MGEETPGPDAPSPLAAIVALPAETPFADPALEDEFQRVRQALSAPARTSGRAILLIATLALFVLARGGRADLTGLAILLGGLALHEGGHLVGLLAFGYADVRMFFIPFLGAAVSGRKPGAPLWQRALVSLAGPLPGILLGLLLASGLHITATLDHRIAATLLVINGLNLLPVLPLDGGWFLAHALFARNRYLEVSFGVVTAGLGILVAVHLHLYILAVLAVLMLLQLPRRLDMARAALLLQAPDLPADPAALAPAPLRALFLAARKLGRGPGADGLGPRVAMMRAVHERAVARSPSARGTIALLLAWLASGAALVLGLARVGVLASLLPAPAREHVYAEDGFAVTTRGELHRSTASVLGDRVASYSLDRSDLSLAVVVTDLSAGNLTSEDDGARIHRVGATLAARFDAAHIGWVPATLAGQPAEEMRATRADGSFLRVRMRVVGDRFFEVVALCTSDAAGEVTDIFDSFRLLDPP